MACTDAVRGRVLPARSGRSGAARAAPGLRDASRWAKLLAPEERYRLMPEGRASLPDALPPRATALRRLADALAANPTLPAAEARALHPKARATLDEWQTRGWVSLETGDAPEQDTPLAPAVERPRCTPPTR